MSVFLQIPKDTLDNRYGSVSRTSSGRSQTRPMYIVEPEESEEDEELDDFVDLVNAKAQAGIEKKIGMNYLGGTDTSRTDKAAFVGNNAILELANDHTTTARKGISPFRQKRGKTAGPPIGTGNAGQAFKTTGNFRGVGTQFGSSRPHKLLTDIEDDSVFDLRDMTDPMERSFLRHQNRVKKVLNFLKEYLNE